MARWPSRGDWCRNQPYEYLYRSKAHLRYANYLKEISAPSLAIAYDSRIKSEVFARTAAEVFAANGIREARNLMPHRPCHLPSVICIALGVVTLRAIIQLNTMDTRYMDVMGSDHYSSSKETF